MKKAKKLLCAVLATCCVFSISMTTVLAATIPFDINTTGDTLSRKEKKSDGEQYFYAKATYFSKRGTLNCISIRWDKTNVYSNNIPLSTTGSLKKAKYRSYAVANKYYYMSGTSSIQNMRVKGKYCP